MNPGPGTFRALEPLVLSLMHHEREKEYRTLDIGEIFTIPNYVNEHWAKLEPVTGRHKPRYIAVPDDAVYHNGQLFRLADLAHYMEIAEREEVHSADTYDPQAFWAEFVQRFPASADHLAEITPPLSTEPTP